MRYTVESLEPRYLLSATPAPVKLTADTTPAATPTQTQVTNNATNAPQVAQALTNIIGNLSYLGQQIDKTSLNTVVAPLINQTLDATGSNPTLASALFSNSATASGLQSIINTDFSSAVTSGTPLTSTKLATDLQTFLDGSTTNGGVSGSYTVTDLSTANTTTGAINFDLQFSLNVSTVSTTDVVLGNAAQEFNLALVPFSGSSVTTNMTTTTNVVFDIKADFSTTPADTTSVANELATYDTAYNAGNNPSQSALDTQLTNDFTFNPGTVQRTEVINDNTAGSISDFGVEFGVMGAGNPAGTDGAYSNGATLELDVDTNIDFGSSSIAGGSIRAASYSVSSPTGDAVAGTDAFTNQATFNLPIEVYDADPNGSSTPSPAGDASYIAGLAGVTGTFTISDANLTDGTTPLVSASSITLASFARLSSASIVAMAQESAYLAGDIGGAELASDLPFLALTQGDAYDFETALQNAFVNSLQTTSVVLQAVNAPSVDDASFPAGDPSNLTGSTTFDLTLSFGTGASVITSSAVPITVTTAANATLGDIVTALNAALDLTSLSSAATAVLTSTANYVDGDTVTLAGQTYTFKTSADATSTSGTLTGANQVLIGADEAASIANLAAAVDGGAGAGTAYGNTTTANGSVTAVAGPDALTVTAKTQGTAGNLLAVSESSTYAGFGTGVTHLSGGGAMLVSAQLVTNSGGSPTIELISHDSTAQFFLSGFTPDATGVLDLGFNQYSNVVAQANGSIPAAATQSVPLPFQLPGVIVQSTTALTLGSFTQAVSFDIGQNGGAAVEVTIPASVYASEANLVTAVQQALIAAGVSDGSQNGVLVQGTTVGNGFGLEFYAGNYAMSEGSVLMSAGQSVVLHSLAFTNPTGPNTNFTRLNLTSPSSTAASFVVSYTVGGVAQTPVTVYVNGNLTNGLLNYQGADASASDLVSDLQLALTQAGLLNAGGTQGITVVASADDSGASVLQFLAANPGSGANQISSFSIGSVTTGSSPTTGTSTLSSLLLVGSQTVTSLSSIPIALASSVTTPAFQTIQQLATLLYDLNLGPSGSTTGVLNGAPSFSAGTVGGSPSFSFPIEMVVNDASTVDGTEVLPDLTGVGLSFGAGYDDVSGLSSTSTVSVSRADTMTFDFGINLITPTPAAEVLTTSVPVTQLFTNYSLSSPGVIEIMPDNGVTYTINVTAAGAVTGMATYLSANPGATTAQAFAGMLSSLISSATSNVASANPLSDYLASVTASTDPTTGEASLNFATVGGSTRELNVIVPETDSSTTSVVNAATTNFGFAAGTQNAAAGVTSLTGANALSLAALTNLGFITFTLPDGTTGTLQINPGDFTGLTSAADIASALNNEIAATSSLRGTPYLALQAGVSVSQDDSIPEIVASVNSSNKVVFSLNNGAGGVYFDQPTTGAWSLSVQTNYLQENPNSLSTDIGLPSQSVSDSTQSATGLLSNVITPATFGSNGLTSSDSFKISINGFAPTTVMVSLTGVTSIGQLVQQLNNALAGKTVTLMFDGSSQNFALSDYLKAEVTNGGTEVMLQLIDTPSGAAYPTLLNAAFQFTAPGGAMTLLGFAPVTDTTLPAGVAVPEGSRELLFTLQGSDGTIGSATFLGTATVVATSGQTGALFTASAAFGITAFNIGAGLLNESVTGSVQFDSGMAPTLDSLVADADASDFTSTDFGAITASPAPNSSYAIVTLGSLSFPTSLIQYVDATGATPTQLEFGSGATITIGYGSHSGFTGAQLSGFGVPATATVVYHNTNNLQLLASLDLDSIVHGLERVGDLLSDWMQNGSGPFSSPLFFELQSLIGIDNLGQDFANDVAGILSNPPTTLEGTPTAILQALQLSSAALSFVITSSPTTGDVVLNISFNWAETFVETLPLAIDLSTLANDSSNETYTAPNGQTGYYGTGVINSFLLGLATIASDPTDPINLNFSEVSQLGVNLNLVVAQNSAMITPEAEISEPTSGNFYQTSYLLDGDSLSGDLPAGAGYLALTNGSLGVDASGQLDINTTVLAVSNSALPALNTTTDTITLAGTMSDLTPSIGGYTLQLNDVGGEILVNDQANAAENGLYTISSYTTAESGISTVVLTQDSSIASIAAADTTNGTATRFYVQASGQSGQFDSNDYFGLASSSATTFSLEAPFVYDTAAASTIPSALAVTHILAATSAAIPGYQTGSSPQSFIGTGSLTIGGVLLTSADVGQTVLINNQADTSENGLYTVTAVSSANGGSWTLNKSSITPGTTRFETAAGVFYQADTPNQFAELVEPATYSYALGAGSYVLPYTVQAATTSDLGSGVTFVAGVGNAAATLTAATVGSINDFQTTDGTNTFSGIDDVQTLGVGSFVLVKNQANALEDGVYEVTSLGSVAGTGTGTNGTHWVLTRASFASTSASLASTKVDVAGGYENVGTRWAVLPVSGTTFVIDADTVTYTQTPDYLYETNSIPWLTFTASGHGTANLPLSIEILTTTGTELTIGNDLQKYDSNGDPLVTISQLEAFYTTGINTVGTNSPLNNVAVGSYTYGQFAPFAPLNLSFNLAGYNGAGPTATPPQLSVVFTSVPDIADSFISPNAITPWQNAFYVGDALDLALFTIQSALSEALAQEFPLVGTSLSGEAEFIEDFRAQFTALVRQSILNAPNTPLEDIRDAIYSAATGLGLLQNFTGVTGAVGYNSILVEVVSNGVSTPFLFDDYTDTSFYTELPNGTYAETTPASTSAITFAFSLGEQYQTQYTTYLSAVNLGDTSIGATIATNTSNYSTGSTTGVNGQTMQGGIQLQRAFTLNLGFGIDVAPLPTAPGSTASDIDNAGTGFFIFNPTQNLIDNPAGTTNPTAWQIENNAGVEVNLTYEPMVDFGFKAELTGDISSTSITPFFQDTYASDVNGLAVDVADGRYIDQEILNPTNSANDDLPSGFYGDVLLNLNFNHPVTAGSPVPTNIATVDDLRSLAELGPDSTDIADSVLAGAIFNVTINADADVDLELQSQQQGLQPASQADMIYDKSYGSGAAASFGLNFLNPAVVGLGSISLGQEEIADQQAYAASNDTDTAALNDFNNIATQVSPIWRFADRDNAASLLLTNGAEGNTFVDYQNIKINILDYLGNILESALQIYEDIIAPLRPYIAFLTTPIPGTTAFTSGGLTIGTLLGSKFETFISDVNEIDSLISPLSMLAAEDTNGSGWVPATATSIDLSALFDGAEYLGGKIADKISEKVKEKYDEYQKKKNPENEEEASAVSDGVSEDDSTSAEASRANAAESDVEETSGDSTSKAFSGENETNKEEPEESDSGEKDEKPSNFSGGLSGGDILLDALDYNTMTNIFQGIDANLLRVQLPELSVSYTFTKKIPIEAFPPLIITLSFTIGFDVNINFGWDTEGFFFNTVDLTSGDPLPLFDFTGKFAIGVGLDFGLVDAEADVYFLATVSFYWNDISGTGKVHESDLQYLKSHGDSPFYVTVTGTVGFDFSIVLSIPVPLIGPINFTIFSYNWSDTLFTLTFGQVTGEMQLGTVMAGSNGADDVLLLNSGLYASQRLFVNTSPVNEIFDLYEISASAAGEDILVVFDNEYYEEFTNIKQVIGYTGAGASEIDAGLMLNVGSGLTVSLITSGTSTTSTTFNTNLQPLQYAVVDLYGGSGDSVLVAGASYDSTWGRSRLQGGTGTGTELLEANATTTQTYNGALGAAGNGVDIIAGGGPADIYGSAGGHDNIVAGQGPDLIYATFDENIYFETGFGNDRIYATSGGNSVSFDGYTQSMTNPTLTSAEIGEFIAPLTVAPISTPLTLSFGPLVESAVSGSSTVFFATDPDEVQRIDDWTGGVGGDTYDVYYFAPSQTLTLNAPAESTRVNTFNVYFGNPNIAYRSGAANNGTVNINDTNSQDVLDETQVFPETLDTTALTSGYSANALNGRELLNYDTQLTVNLNAPNSVVVFGSLTDKTDFDDYKIGDLNVGTIIFISPVEFDSSDLSITVKDTLDILYDVNIWSSAGTSALFTLTVQNAFPTGESDLEFQNNAVLSMSLASFANDPTSALVADGTGTISINLPTGSLENYGGSTGSISIPDGTLAISALYGIGAPGTLNAANIFSITAEYFAATTTSLNDVSNANGIYIQTNSSLQITGYGNMIGLSVAAGDIYVDVEGSANTLSYYKIHAGSASGLGGNVTLIADNIAEVSSFTVTQDVLSRVPTYQTIVSLVPSFTRISLDLGLVSVFQTFFFGYTLEIVNLVTGFQLENVLTPVVYGGASDTGYSISGTGTLSILNATSGDSISIGYTTPTPGLDISSQLLSTIAVGFAGLVIGRTPPAVGSNAPTTGTVNIDPITLNVAPLVEFAGTDINVNGSVGNSYASLKANSSPAVYIPTSSLEFDAQNHIQFSSTGTYAAQNISITSADDLTLQGTFDSEALPNYTGEAALTIGQIQATSTNGNVTINSNTIIEAMNGLSDIKITGDSIQISPTATIEASENVDLDATTGNIMYSGSSTNANAVSAEATMNLTAHTGIHLNIDTPTLTVASTATGNILLTNTYTGTLTIDSMIATTGGITLTTPGEIDLSAGVTPAIILATMGTVSLTSTNGSIYGDTVYSSNDFDIEAMALSLSAEDEIGSKAESDFNNGLSQLHGLVTDVGSLSATTLTTTAGDGSITDINAASMILGAVTTKAGAIAVYGKDNITVEGNVSSAVGNNTILLDTDLLGASNGGSIYLGHSTTVGTVNAGTAVVTLNAADAILGAGALDVVTGSSVLLTAYGLPLANDSATTALINVQIATASVDAITDEAGSIILGTADSTDTLLLHHLQTVNGDITVTGSGSTGINFVTYNVNAGSSNVTLETTGTITDNTALPATSNVIQGVLLTTRSYGDSILKTAVGYLDSIVYNGVGTSEGSLTVYQADGFQVNEAVTTDGFINIQAGQVGVFQAFADADMQIGTITAGGASAVTLSVVGGSIFDPNYGQMGDTSLITGGVLTLTTEYGTEGVTATPRGLNTAVTELDITGYGPGAYVTITQTGNVLVNSVVLTTGDVTITAESAGLASPGTITDKTITTDVLSEVNLTSVSSAIEQQVGKITAGRLNAVAATGITALTDINYLNAAITGTAGNIVVTQDHTVEIGQVNTPSGAFDLTLLAGAVTADTELVSPYNVTATDIDLITFTGIAAAAQFLDVDADLVDASASVSGGIFIHNHRLHTGSSSFILDDITAANGPVDVTSVGNLLARDIRITADELGNDMTLVTTDGGNVVLNFVGTGLADAVPGVTPPLFGNLDVTSAGLINAVDPSIALVDYLGNPINVVAHGINFSAQTGIGTPANLAPIITGSLLTAATVTGDINSGDTSSGDFHISGFSTGNGNLSFVKGGGGNLYATGFVTDKGNVNLTVHNGGTLVLGTINAIGNVTLQQDHINFQGGAGSIFGTGALDIHPDSQTQYVQINSFFAQTQFEQSNILEVGQIGLAAIFTDFSSIYIGNEYTHSLTYMYYNIDDTYLAFGDSSGHNIFLDDIAPGGALPVEDFRLANLLAGVAEEAGASGRTEADIQAIIDQLGDDGNLFNSVDDSSADDDLFFADTLTETAGGAQVTQGDPAVPSTSTAATATAPAEHAAHEDDGSWIDKALVATAATVAVTRPLRRFMGLM